MRGDLINAGSDGAVLDYFQDFWEVFIIGEVFHDPGFIQTRVFLFIFDELSGRRVSPGDVVHVCRAVLARW